MGWSQDGATRDNAARSMHSGASGSTLQLFGRSFDYTTSIYKHYLEGSIWRERSVGVWARLYCFIESGRRDGVGL